MAPLPEKLLRNYSLPIAVVACPEGLRPLGCCDCGFESRWRHGCSSIVCCVGTAFATISSLVQRSPTGCVCLSGCLILCDLETSEQSPFCLLHKQDHSSPLDCKLHHHRRLRYVLVQSEMIGELACEGHDIFLNNMVGNVRVT